MRSRERERERETDAARPPGSEETRLPLTSVATWLAIQVYPVPVVAAMALPTRGPARSRAWHLHDFRAARAREPVGNRAAQQFFDHFRQSGQIEPLDLTDRSLFDWPAWLVNSWSTYLPQVVGPGVTAAILAYNIEIEDPNRQDLYRLELALWRVDNSRVKLYPGAAPVVEAASRAQAFPLGLAGCPHHILWTSAEVRSTPQVYALGRNSAMEFLDRVSENLAHSQVSAQLDVDVRLWDLSQGQAWRYWRWLKTLQGSAARQLWWATNLGIVAFAAVRMGQTYLELLGWDRDGYGKVGFAALLLNQLPAQQAPQQPVGRAHLALILPGRRAHWDVLSPDVAPRSLQFLGPDGTLGAELDLGAAGDPEVGMWVTSWLGLAPPDVRPALPPTRTQGLPTRDLMSLPPTPQLPTRGSLTLRPPPGLPCRQLPNQESGPPSAQPLPEACPAPPVRQHAGPLPPPPAAAGLACPGPAPQRVPPPAPQTPPPQLPNSPPPRPQREPPRPQREPAETPTTEAEEPSWPQREPAETPTAEAEAELPAGAQPSAAEQVSARGSGAGIAADPLTSEIRGIVANLDAWIAGMRVLCDDGSDTSEPQQLSRPLSETALEAWQPAVELPPTAERGSAAAPESRQAAGPPGPADTQPEAPGELTTAAASHLPGMPRSGAAATDDLDEWEEVPIKWPRSTDCD